MGSYTFKWEHPAEEVFVTGTFDNWTKSEQLAKEGDVFQKTVTLKDASQKIYYKYVVDGDWTVNESSPKEADHEGNVNNFITPEDILKSDPAAAFISTVTPQSTTAKMASEQPIEKPEGTATPSDVPGGFPVTPSTELDKPVSVNPLPAAAGAVNPIKLAPGEEVPAVGIESINEHVKLDKESYEKSDALPGVEATELPPVTSNMIPESSLPVVAAQDVHISTVNPDATTVGLAAQVPLEAKVPEVVKESQEKAGAEPEAAADPKEVEEKAQVEEELKAKVTEAPATSEGTAGLGTEKSESDNTDTIAAATAAVAATGAAVVAAAVAAKDSAVEAATPAVNDTVAAAADAANKNLPDTVKENLPAPVQETLAQQETAAKEETREEVSPEVPAEVKESITEAGKNPEAAANTTAVEEKKEVEAELLKEVKPVPAVDEPKAEETKAEEAKVEEAVPVTSATITDVQAIDSPVTEVSNVQVTKTEVPLEEAQKDTPAIEEPKVEAKAEEAKAEEPKVEEPVAEVAKTEAPTTEVPIIDTTVASEAAKTDAPAVDTPVTETDKTEVPPTEATTEAPAKANGSSGSHDDKVSEKKKNRFSAFFSRFRHKLSN
ncbi:carbohydrate-binding module family 48 protein [Trichoderma asperellum CBS 433.97]|uniref:Carbohydrate-binding module family 48 protein n=1 Tax=Trichoderma asperellum (strain ATCC 204424 / CBS 433.97 / NBRC 101777) TaxID=1042311 RepID=A0A2T3YW99_TRIA4|nr:carbohydrate-binding module family 48 protein [Trichoderma asperellum CBS 433.97]PTB36841.1 carbohydrate-binding module family 48 protein [Trichoderma asperellum CBS 433.97]